MNVYEKYKIHVIDGRRYYEYNVGEELPLLDETIPYLFKYNDIEIYENAWTHLSLALLTELDKRNPKTEEYLLGLKYSWSKTDVFSKTKRTNFVSFKNIYLNVNHTSTHALMNIQCLLHAYGVNPGDCYLLINRHPSVEPYEVRKQIIEQEKRGFFKSLIARHFDVSRAEKILSNFEIINRILAKVSKGFDNFYLFDDYCYFANYKQKVIEKTKELYWNKPKNVELVKKYLSYFDEYMRNKDFFKKYDYRTIPVGFLEESREEIEFLFSSLDSKTIVVSKVFSRLRLLHREKMEKMPFIGTPKDLWEFLKLNRCDFYYFEEPYISKEPVGSLTINEIIVRYAYSLDEFDTSDLNAFSDKMHIKRMSNYLSFFLNCSDDYVLVGKGKVKKKSLLDIGEEYLLEFDRALSFYVNSFGKIDSRTFKGYNSFPKYGEQLNKFSFFGITISFFSDKYKIETIGDKYTSFDYVITIKRK